MQSVIENKLAALNKDLESLQNKKIAFSDLQAFKENHLNIRLCKVQMDHLYKMIDEEDYGITI